MRFHAQKFGDDENSNVKTLQGFSFLPILTFSGWLHVQLGVKIVFLLVMEFLFVKFPKLRNLCVWGEMKLICKLRAFEASRECFTCD